MSQAHDMGSKPLETVESVSDTALWVAHLRAMESDRPDALFRDPYARLLAGERGEQLAAALGRGSAVWALTLRTYLLDHLIPRIIAAERIDTVLNLAAGLDSRPYRLDLAPELRWIEVDFAPILAYKEQKLAAERPRCQLERVALDLTDSVALEAFLQREDGRSSRALVLTEGLLVYLREEVVSSLARTFRAHPSVRAWVANYHAPLVKWLMQRKMGRRLEAGSAGLYFAPADGPGYFRERGWSERERFSFYDEAKRLHREPPGGSLGRMAGRLFPPLEAMLRRATCLVWMEPA